MQKYRRDRLTKSLMDDKQFTRVAKALADPKRFEMLRVIAGREEISCGALAQRFPIGQSTVSHHLKVLADAGLVEVRREGQHGYFSAQMDVLEAYVAELRRRMGLGGSGQDADGELDKI
jgi:ArsR family transcriptional regulator